MVVQERLGGVERRRGIDRQPGAGTSVADGAGHIAGMKALFGEA